MIDRPSGGLHYPCSTGELQSWFVTDADCLDYLDWLRWPQGFVCPRWQNPGGLRRGDGSYTCSSCKKETAVTSGTLFDRRRTPLTVCNHSRPGDTAGDETKGTRQERRNQVRIGAGGIHGSPDSFQTSL